MSPVPGVQAKEGERSLSDLCSFTVRVATRSEVNGRACTGGRKKCDGSSRHNRCPINSVVGGLLVTATITVVEGRRHPRLEHRGARARRRRMRSPRRQSLTGVVVGGRTRETQTRHFISSSGSRHCHLYARYVPAPFVTFSPSRSSSPSLLPISCSSSRSVAFLSFPSFRRRSQFPNHR